MIKYDTVVKGQLVMEDKVMYGKIGIIDGKIEKIADVDEHLSSKEEIDVGNNFVFPGAIDVHVHCFSNPKEGFLRASSSAAAGGVTTFLDMPYDLPNPVNNVDQFNKKVELLEQEAIVDIGLWGTISKKHGTEQIIPLAKAGAMSFKMSTFETDEYRFPKIPDSEILKAMNILSDLDILVAFHSENDEIIKDLIKEYENNNKVYPRAHMETRPPVTETSSVLPLMEFAYWTNAKLHIVHVSHPRTIDLIQHFKDQGVKVSAETCYSYLLLDVNDLEEYGPEAKINPPLREREDVELLWERLKDEKIDLISSDHVPWQKEQKTVGNDNIFKAASGTTGLQIIVPLMFDSIVSKRGLSPVQFAKLMSQHPAETFSIRNKGKITVGYDADFMVIDPNDTWKIDASKFYSYSDSSPFHNREGKGKVVQTIVRGKTVYDGQNIVVNPGYGKFVKGSAAE